MPLFTTLSHERICKEIEAADRYVILAAPGSNQCIDGNAVIGFWQTSMSTQ